MLLITLASVCDEERRDERDRGGQDVERGGLREQVGAVRAVHRVGEHRVHRDIYSLSQIFSQYVKPLWYVFVNKPFDFLNH